VFVPAQDFKRLLAERPDVTKHVTESLGHQCHILFDRFRDVALAATVEERVAMICLNLMPRDSGAGEVFRRKVKLTHSDIAEVVGVSRETVSRVLSDLNRRGIAQLSASTLVIFDRNALEEVANRVARMRSASKCVTTG
jgi:CRP/FNR family transcriptional regulator, cyclic AMP receptor protein